jgi:hypothetical protein
MSSSQRSMASRVNRTLPCTTAAERVAPSVGVASALAVSPGGCCRTSMSTNAFCNDCERATHHASHITVTQRTFAFVVLWVRLVGNKTDDGSEDIRACRCMSGGERTISMDV